VSTLDVTTATLPLTSGTSIPRVALGVYQTEPGDETRNAVLAALELGYRHIDTARLYDNERDVGEAIRASGIPRDQIFVTTKLWNDDHGYDRALRAFDKSLERLGLGYIDLFLIHWPVADKRGDSWRALERVFDEGRARAIGVSNYVVRHLDELLGNAKHKPHVNQVELSPFLQRRETRALCAKHQIVVEAYSPLTRGERLADPVIAAVARAVNRTPAQVVLRWSLQHGNVVLPKSIRRERIAENARLFDFTLTDDQMRQLDALDEGFATCWDPEDRA
jgi:diketogulonate reductase-like aldo/keto reductase